jgi:hypothetical protein
MILRRSLLTLVLSTAILLLGIIIPDNKTSITVSAEQQVDDDGGAQGDDLYDDAAAAANYDDAAVAYNDDGTYAQADDDSITYWTDYAILPKRCIVYDNVDVVVFSVHETYYQQCQDTPIGTYITPAPIFLQGYLQYYMQIQEDKGYDDYELPEAADYAYCTRVVIQNEEYWLQIGCTDGNSLSISVNIYSDNTCTTRSVVDGYDDANIDVSEIQVSSKESNTVC